jgi:hypothetical protein
MTTNYSGNSNLEKERQRIKARFNKLQQVLSEINQRVDSRETINSIEIEQIQRALYANLGDFQDYKKQEEKSLPRERGFDVFLPNAMAISSLDSSDVFWLPGATSRDLLLTDDDFIRVIKETLSLHTIMENKLPSDVLVEIIIKIIKEKNSEKAHHNSILFCLADPANLSHLRLSQEMRDIDLAITRSKLRETFSIHFSFSIRPEDFAHKLQAHRPHIVHFSGHGARKGKLCFEDERGNYCKVEPGMIAELLSQFKEKVNCVVLNACCSQEAASVIVEHIDYVVGMKTEISDQAAIAFSVGFYQAIGHGESIPAAFELGKKQIQIIGCGKECDIPILNRKNNTSNNEEIDLQSILGGSRTFLK